MATKAEKCFEIFKDLAANVNNDVSLLTRQTVIDAFVAQAGMTPAGASTYASDCRKKFLGGDAAPRQPKKSTGKSVAKVHSKYEDQDDDRNIFTICVPRVNEDGTTVVDSTSSYYSSGAAVANCKGDAVVVAGMPKLESDFSKLKPLSKK